MKNLKISIHGEEAHGKSTVLVLIAQQLASLGYTVHVPEHLVGLAINVEALHRGTCEETEITLNEVPTKAMSYQSNETRCDYCGRTSTTLTPGTKCPCCNQGTMCVKGSRGNP